VAQRVELARLRVNHPRATVTVPLRQSDLPVVRLRLRWPWRTLELWLDVDGRHAHELMHGRPR
jgi:hypothetical protein